MSSGNDDTRVFIGQEDPGNEGDMEGNKAEEAYALASTGGQKPMVWFKEPA